MRLTYIDATSEPTLSEESDTGSEEEDYPHYFRHYYEKAEDQHQTLLKFLAKEKCQQEEGSTNIWRAIASSLKLSPS